MKLYSLILLILSSLLFSRCMTQCINDSDCNHGYCINITNHINTTISECQCINGYTNFNNEICDYKQKEQYIAYILSIYTGGFGADWFYLGDGDITYNSIGFLKMVLFLMLVCLVGVRICDYMSTNIRNNIYESDKWIITLITIWIIWWITDWIRILSGPCSFKDSNNVCLKKW